jgi:hypothetical protein
VGFILVTLVSTSGCYTVSKLIEYRPKSASGSVFTQPTIPQGKAVVYFFRPDRFMMSGRIISISVPHEANNCFSMAAAGYYPYIAEPGKLHVSAVAHSGNADYNMYVKAGDIRYVKIDYDDSSLSVPAVFEEIPADKALPEIQKCRVVEPCEKK